MERDLLNTHLCLIDVACCSSYTCSFPLHIHNSLELFIYYLLGSLLCCAPDCCVSCILFHSRFRVSSSSGTVAFQRSADCPLGWSSPVHTRSSTLALGLYDSNTLIHNKAWFTYNTFKVSLVHWQLNRFKHVHYDIIQTMMLASHSD